MARDAFCRVDYRLISTSVFTICATEFTDSVIPDRVVRITIETIVTYVVERKLLIT